MRARRCRRALASTGLCLGLAATACAANELVTLSTRPGVTTSYWHMPRPGASTTLLLLPGGAGGIGFRGGQPQSGNFLVRSRELFANHGFHVAVLGRPSDVSDMDTSFRASAAHVEDLRRVVNDLHARTGAPVWLVGTSRGTVSAAAGAIALGPEHVAGIVLTSSVTSYRHNGVPTLALASVRVPVLVLHHEKDACPACAPHEVRFIVNGLTQAPVKKLVWARDGSGPRGDPCEPFHWHGFIGVEAQAVQSIVSWVRQPAP